jgi:hypothetical protein
VEATSQKEPLVEEARASGRYVYVRTYKDGLAEIKTTLLFKTSEEAAECARVLREARKP